MPVTGPRPSRKFHGSDLNHVSQITNHYTIWAVRNFSGFWIFAKTGCIVSLYSWVSIVNAYYYFSFYHKFLTLDICTVFINMLFLLSLSPESQYSFQTCSKNLVLSQRCYSCHVSSPRWGPFFKQGLLDIIGSDMNLFSRCTYLSWFLWLDEKSAPDQITLIVVVKS